MSGVELRLLFWNMRQRAQAAEYAVELCAEHEPHFLVTAETPADFLGHLQRRTPATRRISVEDRVQTFAVDTHLSIRPIRGDRYGEAFEFAAPGSRTHLLVTVHVESQLWQRTPSDQLLAAGQLYEFIERAEADVGHDRTIVIGDFNMDPFSPAMVDIQGLNAMITRHSAQRQRTVKGLARGTFYNPMWSLLGDREQPPASYFFRNTGALGYYWHMLDQVLLRGSVAAEPPDVCVLTKAGTRALLTRQAGYPTREVSDHLPLLVRLNLCSMSPST